MAARFTEHAGDPQWLKDQRASGRRATAPLRVTRAMPYPTSTTRANTVEADPHQFVQGAKNNGAWAFVLGAVAGAVMARGRR